MIALVLGLILVGGVISIFVGTQQAVRTSENLSRIQENARFAFEVMAREIRDAGGNHCGVTRSANVINNAGTTWWANWDEGAIRGFHGNEAAPWKPFGVNPSERVVGTEAIIVRTGISGKEFPIRTHTANPVAPSNPFFSTSSDADFKAGDVVMACDRHSLAIFQVDKVVASAGGRSVEYAVGGTPGNCITDLGVPGGCGVIPSTSKTFSPPGMLSKLNSSFWYVGHNTRGTRSLYRIAIDGTPNPRTDEIADGVAAVSFRYLIRDNTANTLAANYVDAAGVVPSWNDSNSVVVAVRIEADLQSADRVGTDNQSLIRKFYAVVSLRNKEAGP
jgi:type IV pilus assembly protein PilW